MGVGTAQSRLEVLHGDALADLPGFVHGFSTRQGGMSQAFGGHALNLGYTKNDTRENVERNQRWFLHALGASDPGKWQLVTLRQIHSDVIHLVERAPARPSAGDGIITRRPGLLLAVLTADCLPVIVSDPVQLAVGVFHAGWRGTLARIVEKGVGAMRMHFGSRPRDLRAAIGPGVHGCCYAVGQEVRDQFDSQFAYARALFHTVDAPDPVREKYPLLFLSARPPGHGHVTTRLHLDLVDANRRQLLAAGLSRPRISASDLCTACRTDLLFSHRAESGRTGRMMAVVGIRPEKP